MADKYVKEKVMKVLDGSQIRKRRLALGISQVRLASLIGCHKNSMCRVEKGQRGGFELRYRATDALQKIAANRPPVRGLS